MGNFFLRELYDLNLSRIINNGYLERKNEILISIYLILDLPKSLNSPIFKESEKKGPSVPYIAYSEEHNPFNILETGQNTEHLYH